jgi:hypothetical protein
MPSPEQQARFFTNLQLLLAEGEFVSTYKFALLIALVRWAVEHPDHDEVQPIDAAELAPHFIELYWPQVLPFAAGGVLVQERGGQGLRVINLITEEQKTCNGTLLDLPVLRRDQLLAQVRAHVGSMPLWKLHTVNGEQIPFLYHRGTSDREIVFEPGIVACLVDFAQLVEDAVKASWLRFVLRWNPNLLGATCQVEDHLFPGERKTLAVWREALDDLQAERCFYCEGAMRGDVAVDHFLPWSRYARDLGHNFVLAHAECNGRKRNHLASSIHLARWCERNEQHGSDLARRFDERGLPHDLPTLKRVACALYRVVAISGANVWHAGRALVPLTDDWRRILGCA